MSRSGRLPEGPVSYWRAIAAEASSERLAGAPDAAYGSIPYDNTSKSPAQAMLPQRLVIVGAPNTAGAKSASADVSQPYEPKNNTVKARPASRSTRRG